MAKFLIGKKCNTMIGVINDDNGKLQCCGEDMTVLEANTTDAATEKHVPVVKVDGSRVEVVVGDVIHPMSEEHWIQWIYLETEKGGQRKVLAPTDEPKAVFEVVDDKPVAVYEYCNLHGLWKTEL